MVVAHTERVGQYSKRKSVEQMFRPWAISFVGLSVAVYAIGYVAGLSAAGMSTLYFVLAAILVSLGTWIFFKWITRI